ncbi:phospholipase-like, aminotransferase-like mobile domain protein [Tanacetum coccineum]
MTCTTNSSARWMFGAVAMNEGQGALLAVALRMIPEYHARVHVKSKLHYFPLMKDRLGLDRCVLFRETCFGRWLDLTYVENAESIIHYMLQKQKVSDNDHYELPLIYNVNGHTLHFDRREFCLISGFKFGWISFRNFREGDITFRDRVFPEKIGDFVKNIDLLSLIEDEERFTSLSDSDSIRVCLLLSLEVIFMGHELGSAVDGVFLRMVKNLEVWNDFPWGEHMWRAVIYVSHQRKVLTQTIAIAKPKALEINPNFVSTYYLFGFVLCFKIWILEPACVTDCWWSKLSEEIPRGRFWSKHLPFQNGSILDKFFPMPKNQTMTYILTELRPSQNGLQGALIFSSFILRERRYKLKSVGKQCDFGDKYWSDEDGEFFKYIGSSNPSANKDAVNELVDALDDLVDEDDCVKAQKLEAEKNRVAEQRRIRLQLRLEEENSMKSIDFSKSTHIKLAIEKCGTNKMRYVNVLRPPMEEYTNVKEEDLNRPFICIDKIYCNYYLEQFLITSGWRLCKFPWCNEIFVDRPFWDSLIGLDDNCLGWLLDDVFIPINEPKRHWSLAQFHIQSRNVTFCDSQKIYDVEYHPWYVKMMSCLESKLHVVL